eukprot:1494422-Amphidinium_carterae.2
MSMDSPHSSSHCRSSDVLELVDPSCLLCSIVTHSPCCSLWELVELWVVDIVVCEVASSIVVDTVVVLGSLFLAVVSSRIVVDSLCSGLYRSCLCCDSKLLMYVLVYRKCSTSLSFRLFLCYCTLAGSAAKDPQVLADVTLVRTWDRWIQSGGVWPPSPAMWTSALSKRGGPLSALAEFAHRVSWHPGHAGWTTARGFVPWCQASATAAQDSQAWHLKQLALRRPDWRKLSNGATHAGRAACSAAASWRTSACCSCTWCQVQAGTLHHLLFVNECPAWAQASGPERGFPLMPLTPNGFLTMDWFRRTALPSRCGRKFKLWIYQGTRFG